MNAVRTQRIRSALLLASTVTGLACAAATGDALQESPAHEAYFQIEANVFNARELRDATSRIATAHRANPDDPWVYLATSLATLVRGYQIGDWYEERTFRDGVVEQATAIAQQALVLGPHESQAHAHLARLKIIRGEYLSALELLDESARLDSANFYPWYFRGIAARKMGDFETARSSFDRAAQHAALEHQDMILTRHRQDVERLAGNFEEQERLLLENIRRHPTGPHVHGNYAHFLMRHRRYEEAVTHWEHAIELGRYPEAVRRLPEAKQLAARAGRDPSR